MKIKDLANGGIFSDGDWVESKDQDTSGKIRLIQLADLGDGVFLDKSNRFMNEETAERLRCTFLKKGDILIARMPDPIGRACLFPFENEKKYVTVVDVGVLRLKQHHCSNYVMYGINSPLIRRQIESQVTGTTRQRITRKKIGEIDLPLPPLDQQKKIAAILDAADAYRQKTKALIEKYDELTQSLFLDMFGDPVSNPKKLPVKSLGELCEFYSGRAWKKAELGSHGYKLVRISNLHKQSFPYWLYEGEMIEKHKVEDGDLLFSWAGVQASIDAYIYKGETAMINQHIYNIKPRNEISKLFLYNLLQLHLDNLRGSLGGGVGQFHLKKTDVTGIKVILPNEVTMNKYLSSLASLNKQKAQAEASLAQAEDLFNSLLQRAFKGELTT